MAHGVKNDRGFTLIEVIVSLIILAVGILTVIGVFPHIARFGQNSNNISIATALAQEKLDELLCRNEETGSTPLSDNPASCPGFHRQWWGEDMEKASPARLQRVFVTVSWQFRNQEKAVVLSGLMGPLTSAKGNEEGKR